MGAVHSFRVAFGATVADDEWTQRRALIRRISCVRWLGVVAAIALNRMLFTYAVIVGAALYNIVPFRFASRLTARELRVLGWMLLVLDAIALSLASLPVVERRNFPVLALLLFFEASVIVGFEPPRLSTIGMAAVTFGAVGYGLLAIRYGDSWQDVVLWTLLCLFLGIRGALIAVPAGGIGSNSGQAMVRLRKHCQRTRQPSS